jgi:hypothetical protein
MTEAAEKIGLKPETLLAHAMHIPGADAVLRMSARLASARERAFTYESKSSLVSSCAPAKSLSRSATSTRGQSRPFLDADPYPGTSNLVIPPSVFRKKP